MVCKYTSSAILWKIEFIQYPARLEEKCMRNSGPPNAMAISTGVAASSWRALCTAAEGGMLMRKRTRKGAAAGGFYGADAAEYLVVPNIYFGAIEKADQSAHGEPVEP